jgi:hypothetical protein
VVDISDPASPQEVGLWETNGVIEDVVVSGGMAFVAREDSVVHMVNVNQANAPVEVAYYDTMVIRSGVNFNNRIAVSENTVYFADTNGLWVFDAGQVSLPTGIGYHDTPGSAGKSAKEGNFLYVADGESGLTILDVSATDDITDVGHLDTPGVSQDVLVSGTMAYIADGEEGLRIIDVSTPGSPVEVGAFDAVQNVDALALVDSVAYLADWWGVKIIDVSNPLTPTLIGNYGCSAASDFATTDELLLVACSGYGLHIVNVSIPEHPVPLASVLGWAAQVTVSGDTAFVSSHGAFTAIDLSEPMTPTVLGKIYLPQIRQSNDMTINGNTAYLAIGKNIYYADGDQGLVVIDISDPTQLREIVRLDTDADSFGVTFDNGIAYLGSGALGVNIVDVSNVNGLIEIGRCGMPVYSGDVAVKDDYAYVMDGSLGLKVIDVSTPTALNWVNSLDQIFGSNITISGSYAYVSEGAGLGIIDIGDPSKPVQIGLFSMPHDQANTVVLAGSMAYVAGNKGLYLIDVSDPTRPLQLAHYDESGGLDDLALSDNFLYATGSMAGGEFLVLDVSTPEAPLEIGSYDVQGHFVISGTYAYIAASLTILDISNPTSPNLVGKYNGPPNATDVAVIGPNALVTSLNEGMRVFDVSDPALPKEIGHYNTPGTPKAVIVAEGLVYLADEFGGLMILSLEEPEISRTYLPMIVR